MAFPIKTCVKCGEEFELRPNKPGYANRCYDCSAEDESDTGNTQHQTDADQRQYEAEANEARRKAIRQLLYSKGD